MSRNILYAYIDGYDLDDVATVLESDITSFLQMLAWPCGDAWLVSDREYASGPEADLPRWDLGMNFELPLTREELVPHFTKIEDLAVFFHAESGKTGREFVLGVCDTVTGDTWEFALVGPEPVNIERIRRALLPERIAN